MNKHFLFQASMRRTSGGYPHLSDEEIEAQTVRESARGHKTDQRQNLSAPLSPNPRKRPLREILGTVSASEAGKTPVWGAWKLGGQGGAPGADS